MSAFLNSLSGTIYTIFLRERLTKKGIDNEGLVLKILVVIIGVISMLLVYVAEHLGEIVSLVVGIVGIAYGPLMGIFSLGLFFPTANSKVKYQFYI